MKSKILLRLTVCTLLLALAYISDVRAVSFRAKYFNECEGNACSVVELNWDNERQQFRVKNNSNQRVKVEVSTFAGASSIIVPPNDVNYLEVKTFNGPYRANYE
ncbi:MAG TPA: hypothetical protein VHH35_04760 [Pyrinomonadaceae bacterium]|nr:hypothetical protein [Pyrinomonadaceae bacterium]